MKKTFISLSILCLLTILKIASQTSTISKIENELSKTFQSYEDTPYEDRYEIQDSHRRKVQELLNSSFHTFRYSFPDLKNHLTMCSSKNGNVKTFSWDELIGGSLHDMAVFVQYLNSKGQVISKYLDVGMDKYDIGDINTIITNIYQIKLAKQTSYLFIGYGTHGSGKKHASLNVFRIENDLLKDVTSEFLDNKYINITVYRTQDIGLEYDEEAAILRFNNYSLDLYSDTPSDNKTTLKLLNGRFRLQPDDHSLNH